MTDPENLQEGLRERKRRETHERIIASAMQLFAADGYEGTTLDAIAAAAGISRRTFFHYFKSKDDILLSLQSGLGDSLVAALAEQPLDAPPFRAMRNVLIAIAGQYSIDELVKLDRVMRASEAVQARKQAFYLQEEGILLAGLRARWPEVSEVTLRLLAFISIGMSRLAIDAWTAEGGTRPLAALVEEIFDALAGAAKTITK
ncbi:hypothetical protein VW35_19755 [Devosia soli]|uniref:HTH tetR-type domain-containing protein n=1 Tax=Devosia soli TaxID=361041 RepID=A0A0F5L2V6_9HYPH|nr:TetR/AcrR family transcriptional regulator [Devosia soli]KKB75972.1 hypothetical protein VW35_19755 [Devosia soli]